MPFCFEYSNNIANPYSACLREPAWGIFPKKLCNKEQISGKILKSSDIILYSAGQIACLCSLQGALSCTALYTCTLTLTKSLRTFSDSSFGESFSSSGVTFGLHRRIGNFLPANSKVFTTWHDVPEGHPHL